MQEYIAMWTQFANFGGKTNVRGYWMAWLFNFLASFVLGFVDGLLGITILSAVYSLAVLIPGLSIAVRRLNDAGYSWKSLLWMLLPLVGWIIVLVRLCRPSVVSA
ncbi:MAG: DUF805 domain-containing protein [Oscillospiraceae bacterium]|nr:DUF805 domain-containing protein [Oscillospiraceae bacterium]